MRWSGWADAGRLRHLGPERKRTGDGGTQLRVLVRGPANHLFMNTLDERRAGPTGKISTRSPSAAIACVDLFNWGAHCYDSSGGSAVQLTNVTEETGAGMVLDDIGGAVNGKVSAVSTGADGDELRVFVRGPGNKLWVKTWDTSWDDWSSSMRR